MHSHVGNILQEFNTRIPSFKPYRFRVRSRWTWLPLYPCLRRRQDSPFPPDSSWAPTLRPRQDTSSSSHPYLELEIARARDRRDNPLAECLSPVQTAPREHSQSQGQRQEREPSGRVSLISTHCPQRSLQGPGPETRKSPLSECLSPVKTANTYHSQGQGQKQDRESASKVSLTSKECPHIS